MYKLSGAVLIILSGIIFGFSKSYYMKKRIASLSALLLAFQKISAEISFTKHRIERIFTEISKELSLPIFYDAALLIRENGLNSAWIKSLDNRKNDMALTKNDINVVKKFPEICSYTGDAQKRSEDTVLKLLKLCLAEAEGEYEKTGKLVRSVSCLLGVLIVILLY